MIFFFRFKQFERNLKKIEIQYYFSPRISQILRLTNLFLLNIYIIHLCACVWILIAKAQGDSPKTWLHLNNIIDEQWQIQYLNAFYFNTVTMVTVGYGDISPQTNFERMFSILTVLSACGVFAYSISEVGNIFLEMNKSLKKRKNNMFYINNYMKKKKVTSDLQYQIRHYLEYYWNESLSEDSSKEQSVINQLSNNLKENLMIEANRILVLESPFFRENFSFKTILKVVSLVQEQRCTPEEIVYLEGDIEESSIFFIEKGSVQLFHTTPNEQQSANKEFIECNTLRAGEYFGEVSFFTGCERRFSVRSLEFSTLIKIDRVKFLEVIKESPLDYEKFCLIRDDIILNNNFKYTLKKCCYCKQEPYLQAYHRQTECPMVHYIPNKARFIWSKTQQIRQVKIRESQKNFNTLGRIEQVRGDQNRLLFSFEQTIAAYMIANSLQAYIKDEEDEEYQLNQLTNSTSSNSSDQESQKTKVSKIRPSNNGKNNEEVFSNTETDNGDEDKDEDEVDDETESNISSHLKNNQESYAKNIKFNKISRNISKSIVIEEDQLELESQPIQVKTQSFQQTTNNLISEQTDEFDGNFDIEEQCLDSVNKNKTNENICQPSQSQLINNVKPFSTKQMKKTTTTLPETNYVLTLPQSNSDIGDLSQFNISSSQTKMSPNQPIKIDISQDQLGKKSLILQQSFEKKGQQFSSVKKTQDSLSDLKQVRLSPITTKQKMRNSITQSVKFKLPPSHKKSYIKNKSLQELDNNLTDLKKKQEHKKKSQSSLTNLPQVYQANTIYTRLKSKSQQNQINQKNEKQVISGISLPELRKTLPILRRLCSKSQEMVSNENVLNSTFDNINIDNKNPKSHSNDYQQRFSSQLDNLVNNFQKIQDILVSQTNYNFQPDQSRFLLSQKDKESNSLKEFDKMKAFEIYFPENNYEIVISHFNKIQINKNKPYKHSKLYSPTNLKIKNLDELQNSSSKQVQVLQDLFSQNTLNRLKYLRNENHKKNSMGEQMFLSSIQRNKPDSNKTTSENTDQMSPSNKKTNQVSQQYEEDLMKSQLKQQNIRLSQLETSPKTSKQHQLIIPNYFGIQKQSETSISLNKKKSRFSKRTSIFKTYENEQGSNDSPISNDKNTQEIIQINEN